MSTSDSPLLSFRIVRVTWRAWEQFAPHHYLTASVQKGSRCYLAVLDDDTAVAFTAYMRFPHPRVKNGWRAHRTVVLPDFQGLGIGPRLGEAVGEMVLAEGGRYYSRTTHPRLIAFRDASPKWRVTGRGAPSPIGGTTNLRGSSWSVNRTRQSVSHEYIGGRHGCGTSPGTG